MNLVSLRQKYPKAANFFGKAFELLKSEAIIGGISVSNSAVRFIRLGETIEKIGVILEPGIIADGKLKNREAFLKALLALRYKLGSSKEEVHAIISLPPDNIYTQAFSLPTIEERLLNDAAKLNIQLLSPIDVKTAYTDWEKIGETEEDGGKIELLGGFVSRAVVDDFVSVFRQAGFAVVAVEFPALSVARLIKEASYNANIVKPQVALSVSSDGLEFIVVKNSRLYFNYFVSWSSVEGRQISMDVFSGMLAQEMKKVLNFYSSHWNDQLTDLILITQGLNVEIENVIKQNFPNIGVKPFILNEKFSSLTPAWYSALGSAIRGKLPRSQDIFISLMDVGTEQSFFESRVVFFVKIWRTVLLSILGALVFFFFLGEMFFVQVSNGLNSQLSLITQKQESQEVATLTQKARDFNNLVTKALAATKSSRKISRFFDIFTRIAGKDVVMQKILFDSDRATVLITATANSNQAVINFKNGLAARSEFRNVDFSFTSTTNNPDGTISFPITFGVNL